MLLAGQQICISDDDEFSLNDDNGASWQRNGSSLSLFYDAVARWLTRAADTQTLRVVIAI